ncbi:PAS domain-containing sensor histidine kinase [Pseudodesulfovibrio pelocollis]|uniref:PAS domain-containing sensor histidine kinase n=1 Tax=Pseudodesulfovibrio pelocollis TaxID=3051432 RepID=UPI00255ABF1A|nr:ATP-binding protein [Pseudodesulfovibrio sp. SB368]
MNLHNYYDTVMQLSHGIVVTFDLGGRIIHGNSELEKLTGYSIKELAGRDWFKTFIPEDRHEKAIRTVTDSIRGQTISTTSGIIRTRSGDTVYIDWHIKSLVDSAGEPISVLCVGQDVTDHMLRQKGLIYERSTLMERNKELSCLYHISLLMVEMNEELPVILSRIVNLLPSGFQRPRKTHISLTVDDIHLQSPGYRDTDNRLTEPITVNKERRGMLVVSLEGHGRRARNAEFIEDENDLLATVAQQIALIVAKKEERRARQQLEQQLRQADRLAKIGQFSAGLAHEINEPLANILGFAQLALQTPGLPEQVETDLRNIVDSSLHAREVIRKVMLFGRQMPPQLVMTDLNATITQALRITEAGAKRNRVEVACQLDQTLPPVMADPQHITQVVVNLAANAIQAMENGGALTVRTINHGGDAYIVIEDTGPGMHPEELRQIFTPFYTTKDVDKGTGLGLSVVHGIVKAHQGFIQVDSTPGQGTRFEVAFPCSQTNGAE